MAAPSTLAVSVDLEEYSRFEDDKKIVTVSVLPGVPTSDVAVASLVGATSLSVTDGTVFPAVGSFQVTVGAGAVLETATVLSVVDNTLNLAAPLTHAHAICDAVVQVVSLVGEQIVLQMIKARRNRDVVVATQQITYTSTSITTVIATFDLTKIVDHNDIPRVRRGSYFIRATSATAPSVTAETPDFLVSVISVDRFKSEWLHGADQLASETESVKNQPELIRGCTVNFVSRGHQKGWFPLSYNYSNPGGCAEPVRLLSWCGGPVVSLQRGKTKYTLRKGKSQSDYIDVIVPSVDTLPTQSVAEELLVEREPIKDSTFRAHIERAINWVEDTALMCFIEPTRVVTEVDPNAITYPAGSDIPDFVQADWDKVVDALTYQRPAAGHWVNFRMPYYPTQEFYTLYGKASNVRIIDIALEWVSIDKVGGFVELVPFNQEVAFNFIGLIWVESLRGPIPIPNFWNFDALVGYPRTPEIIIELIGKKAAIVALTQIGQAFRVGVSSQSVSRDGVSESVSYLSSGQYGIFSGTIKTYQEWIDTEMPKLRGAYKGVNMIVV